MSPFGHCLQGPRDLKTSYVENLGRLRDCALEIRRDFNSREILGNWSCCSEPQSAYLLNGDNEEIAPHSVRIK